MNKYGGFKSEHLGFAQELAPCVYSYRCCSLCLASQVHDLYTLAIAKPLILSEKLQCGASLTFILGALHTLTNLAANTEDCGRQAPLPAALTGLTVA